MKKIITILLIVACVFSMLFAEDPKPSKIEYPGFTDFAFEPIMVRRAAVGGSSVASPSRIDSLYENPAALADGRFGMIIPSTSVTLYNLASLLQNPKAAQYIENITKKQGDEEKNAIGLLTEMINGLGNGKNEFLSVDTNVAAAFKLGRMAGLGISVDVSEKMHTLSKGSSNVANVSFIPEINVAGTIALGTKVIDTPAFSLNIGGAVHYVTRMYLEKISASKVLGWVSSEDFTKEVLWNSPTMAGFALPIDAGITVGLLNDTIKIGASATNLNGSYNMTAFGALADAVNEAAKSQVIKPESSDYKPQIGQEFEIETPWSLNIGASFVPDISVLRPVISVDFVDTINFFNGKEKVSAQSLLLHLNAGAEVNLFNVINIRAGINRGYASVGVGFGLFVFRVDATYGWQEFGNNLGDKPVDSLTLRFALGYDKI